MDIHNGQRILVFMAFRTAFFATEDTEHTQSLDLSQPSQPIANHPSAIANSYQHIAWNRWRCQGKAAGLSCHTHTPSPRGWHPSESPEDSYSPILPIHIDWARQNDAWYAPYACTSISLIRIDCVAPRRHAGQDGVFLRGFVGGNCRRRTREPPPFSTSF